jgi:MoaA/NifB/PqqE/SkfB family radical SAM enzyme
MLDKIYLEITNVCNLSCSFCHKTKREKRLMTAEEFDLLTDKLKGKIRFLYFHLMGEPTLHPLLPDFIRSAREKGFLPMLTTNGSLLGEKGELLLQSLPHKISISLHAPEANPTFSSDGYLDDCILFAKRAAEKGCIVALRLWNLGSDADNSDILSKLHEEFPGEWKSIRGGISEKLGEKLFLEWGERFEWPDDEPNEVFEGSSGGGVKNCDKKPLKAFSCESKEEPEVFCYALRTHAGVLVDGSVVPCCLDADGVLTLGNLFESELDDILASPRAKAIFDGFSQRRAAEKFCQSCGFVKKFNIKS